MKQTIFKAYAPAAILLMFASIAAMLMLHNRALFTGETWRFLFFPWNLFLAWIPFILSILLCSYPYRSLSGWKKGIWWFAAAVWLLFYPNAPYLLTDFIHLNQLDFIVWDKDELIFNPDVSVWYDLIMSSLFIGTGLLLGCLSLHQIHDYVRRMGGVLAGWFTAVVVIVLSGYGIYLGRFVRLNSWDIIQPVRFARQVADTIHSTTALFVALFSGFLFIAYIACYMLISMRNHGRE